MIAYIEGKITVKNPAFVVIDIQGIGYQLNISLHTYEKIVNLERCLLLAHPVIREDAHTLYGFFDESERELFRQLISVSGIGPNTARMMLSSINPEELKNAIIREDVSLIKTVKGIGQKTAQRLIVELKDILKKTATGDMLVVGHKNRVAEEAVSALTMLGFARASAEKVISKIVKTREIGYTVEEIIKQALKEI